ncbi:hypothetical protein CsSME_00009601 [Camellia sinensis var. sinensis]
MESSMSTATSSRPSRMCAYGFGHCVVKISRSVKNLGPAYYVYPSRTMRLCCPFLMQLVMCLFICRYGAYHAV